MPRNIMRYEKLKQSILSDIKANHQNLNLVTNESVAWAVASHWAKFQATKYSALKGGLRGLIRDILIEIDGGTWHSDLTKDVQMVLESVEKALGRCH